MADSFGGIAQGEAVMTKINTDAIADALWGVFESPNEADSNFESANLVDGLFAIARAIDRLAHAVEDGRRAFQGQPTEP